METPSINLKEFDQDDIPVLLGVSREDLDGKVLKRGLYIATLDLRTLLEYNPEAEAQTLGFRNITKLDLNRDELADMNWSGRASSDLF